MLPEIPAGVAPGLYYVCVISAVLIIAISKAGFGGGIGILSVPLTVLVLPPTQALGMMLPILIVADVFAWHHHRTGQAKKHLRWLITGCFIGVVVASALLALLAYRSSLHAPGLAIGEAATSGSGGGGSGVSGGGVSQFNRWLKLLIGAVCLYVVVAQVYRMVGGRLPRLPDRPATGYASGALAGFLSTLAQSAGPVTNIYLLEMGFDKSVHVSTSVLYYLVNNLAKVPFYLTLSYCFPAEAYFSWANLKASLLFLPLIPPGTWLGAWMHRKLDERPFNAIMYFGAALAAGWMIYQALA